MGAPDAASICIHTGDCRPVHGSDGHIRICAADAWRSRVRAEEHLERWRRAGLLTAEQADRIRAHESVAGPAGDDTPGRSRVAEALGYVGGTLALGALAVVVEDLWSDLPAWAQAGLLGLLAVILLAAGAWVRARDDAALRRLSSVLWLLSTLSVAFMAGVVVELPDWSGEADTLAVGAVTAAYAGVLWWLRPTAPQLVIFSVAVATTVATGLALPALSMEEGVAGLALWGVAVAWALLTWTGTLTPRRTGYTLGAIGTLVGAQIAASAGLGGWGHLLGLVTSALLVVASVPVGEVVLLALGAVGTFGFIAATVLRYFEDSLGVPLALFLVGLAFIGASLLLARLGPRVARRAGPEGS